MLREFFYAGDKFSMFKITIDENEYERDSLTAENKVELKHMVTSVTKIVEL
jgi:hypothetical protein